MFKLIVILDPFSANVNRQDDVANFAVILLRTDTAR